MAPLHIGIDLDNTIVRYDRLFHALALANGWIDERVLPSKRAVREAVRARPDGDIWWTRLQGVVYGQHMADAEPAPGLDAFLRAAHHARVPVSIVSHKARFPAQGPRIDLHAAAHAWLQQHLLAHADDFGIHARDIHFEPTQALKAERVIALGCTHWIDDLPEFLALPALQGPLVRMLYAPEPPPITPEGVLVYASWDAILRAFAREESWTRSHARP